MQKLKSYLTSLKAEDRDAFAVRCGTTLGYLNKCIYLGLKFREKTCALIERESQGAVTRQELRPDDWHEIWPELAGVGGHDQRLAA